MFGLLKALIEMILVKMIIRSVMDIPAGSAMMIRLSVNDSERTIKLFGKNDSCDLMGKSHFGKRKQQGGMRFQTIINSVSATNEKNNPFCPNCHDVFNICSKFF